jgi:hypothetical protein
MIHSITKGLISTSDEILTYEEVSLYYPRANIKVINNSNVCLIFSFKYIFYYIVIKYF